MHETLAMELAALDSSMSMVPWALQQMSIGVMEESYQIL